MIDRLLATLGAWRRGRISLRSRITGAFTLVVVGGTAVSTLIGSRIITNAILEDARNRAVHGLEAALTMYEEEIATTTAAVARASAATPPAGLDFVAVVPATSPCLASASFRALVERARSGPPTGAAEVLSASCLASLDPHLPARVPATAGPDRGPIVSAFALVAAARTSDGVLCGGILLNGRTEIVNRVKRLVYGDGRYEDRDVGSASIFLDSVAIAASAGRRTGTRAPADVAAVVLGAGTRWHGRTHIAGEWRIGAFEPLRNHAGEVVGMLHVGTLEAPILAVRTDVMLTFLAVCVVGLAIVFALTYLITRRTISPLEEMVAATKKIAAGDLAVRVSAVSDDEIGVLAGSFNDMLSSLEATKRELEQWGHTLEDKVRERTDQLVAVQEQMVRSEKLASIGRLAAGVAHSVNNPLGGILSLSMLAGETCKDPALSADLDTIAKQALRCREIVKGLLEFSHQSDAQVTRTDVNAIIDAAVLLLQRQAVFHNVSIERSFGANLPQVLINPGQLQDAVTNLLVNAVDAMEGGGTVTVETAALPVAREVLVHVADTGCGIPEKNLPYLFEPFFTTKKVGKGTGLGLAIVHGIVTGAGGRVEVATGSSGTRFTIHLPFAPEAARADVSHALSSARAGQ